MTNVEGFLKVLATFSVTLQPMSLLGFMKVNFGGITITIYGFLIYPS
jgi:hypothetical protein